MSFKVWGRSFAVGSLTLESMLVTACGDMSYPDPVCDRGAIKNGQASSVVMVVDFLATVIFRPRLVVTSTTSIFSTVFK